jgi:tRNA threonylcarbamoyl adenosine modification protein YjeE
LRGLLSSSEEETEEFGRRLAERLGPEEVVYLCGALGAGKTALARGLARGRGALPRQVASPSFAILHEYAGADGGIVLRHLDLYRLADRAADLEALGLPEGVAGSPVAVEWPGQAIRVILPPTVEIEIEVLPDGKRRIEVRRAGAGGWALGEASGSSRRSPGA